MSALALSAPASADMLHIDRDVNPDRGHSPIEELSYEVIVAGSDGYRADVRIRLALYNSSRRAQDLVLNLALPRASALEDLRIARDGTWFPGTVTDAASGTSGRRRPGTIFARSLAPKLPGDLPGAQVIGFALGPGSTTQVELVLRVAPEIRGTHWELMLPGRGDASLGLSKTRRVLVKASEFWVDGRSNAGLPMVESPAADGVRVTWNLAQANKSKRRTGPLRADIETTPNLDNRGGSFRMYLQPGAARGLKPDHIVVVLDRSRSTAPDMHRAATRLLKELGQNLSATTTFDVVSFARTATAYPQETPKDWPTLAKASSIAEVAQKLDRTGQQQGTNLADALGLVGTRLQARGARRPLVLVLTDGMMPVSTSPETVRQKLVDNLGSRRLPDFVFLIDEPMLFGDALKPGHPAARLAKVLKARIRLQSLASNYMDLRSLLTAPPVITELRAVFPRTVTLTSAVPEGLVAGSVAVVEGTYTGRAPRPRVRARIRGQKVQRTANLRTHHRPKHALVASEVREDLKHAAAQGLVTPSWYTRSEHHRATLSITNAGRGGLRRRGFLDARIFRNYLGTRVYPRARACYNLALSRNQSLEGRVVVEVEVGKGEVMHASLLHTKLTHTDREFL
ncbi:MAG: VWA domain-containing protein, partial [Nannocystaceae bacterium]